MEYKIQCNSDIFFFKFDFLMIKSYLKIIQEICASGKYDFYFYSGFISNGTKTNLRPAILLYWTLIRE